MNEFRAWDSFFKEMLYEKLNDLYLGISFTGDVIAYDLGESHDNEVNVYGDRLIPMQWSGIRDANDSKVYEGDIVTGKRNSHWHEGFDKVKGVVIYRNETASFEIDSSLSKALMNGGSLHKTEELEIIGNIYENPELLVVEGGLE